MTLLLPTLAVAFAAFCVWLTVRIVNRRERWTKWTLAAVVGLPLFYVASFGPACWSLTRDQIPLEHKRRVYLFYHPLTSMFAMPRNANVIVAFLQWYSCVGADGKWGWWYGIAAFDGRESFAIERGVMPDAIWTLQRK